MALVRSKKNKLKSLLPLPEILNTALQIKWILKMRRNILISFFSPSFDPGGLLAVAGTQVDSIGVFNDPPGIPYLMDRAQPRRPGAAA